MLARALAAATALVLIGAIPAQARPAADVRGGAVLFYNDSLRIVHGASTAQADAIAFDLAGDRIDLLRAAVGIQRLDPTLAERPAPAEGSGFVFPEFDDRRAYIRARSCSGVVAGRAIYLSTDRSSYSPAELRMDQVDARRYTLDLRMQEGGRLAFRVTRGSFQTIERDAKGRLPPPHIVTGHAGSTFAVTVATWSDDL